ncbi:MAG TPA: TonB-dependent receptor [Cyclobacteriaceae bacterium]
MKNWFLYCLVFLIHLSAFAQEDSLKAKRLDEVVIKSFRLPGNVSRLPGVQGTSVWTGKKSEVLQVANMDANLAEKTGRQIFAKIPGVFVYDMDGSGNQVNISTRGLDPHRGWEFNIRRNGTLTNSDMYGYPASHYSMPMEAVERIEMVRGTGSLQYGAQFGGMINYVTKRADTTKKFGFQTINSVGSFGLLSTYNAIGGKIGKVEYYAYYTKRVSDGYRDNASSDYDAQSFMIAYSPTEKLKLRAEVSRSSYVYRIPGPLTDDMFYDNPRQSTRTRNYFNPDIYVPSITLDWSLSDRTKLSWNTSAVLGERNSVQFDKPADVVDAINPATLQYTPRQVDIDHFNSYTTEFRLLHHYNLFGGEHLFTTGFQIFNNDLHRQQLGKGTTGTDFDLSLTEPGFGRDMHFKTKNLALFIENSFRLTPKLSVNPGIRFETGQSDMSGTITYYDPGDLPNTIEHTFPLLGINTEYKINSSQNFYAGWSQSYRPVIFKDIIPASTYEVVDKNLKDAKGHTFEAGYRGSISSLHWDIGVFQLAYNNRLGSLAEQDGNGAYYLYRTNIGNSLTKGMELFVEQGFHVGKADLSVFTSTALFLARYTDAHVRSGETNVDIRGNKVESVPDVITRNGITFRYAMFSITGLYSYTASSYADALNTKDPSANGAVGLVPAYGLLDFNSTLNLSKNLVFKLNLNNATNEQYFTKRPAFYPGPGVWSSDGRSWSASISLKV